MTLLGKGKLSRYCPGEVVLACLEGVQPKELASRRVAWFGNGAPRVAGVSEGIRNDSEAIPEPGQSESCHCMSVPRLNSWVVDEERKSHLWAQVEEETLRGAPTRDAVPRVVSSLTE